MSRFAYFFSMCQKYIPEGTALLNSLHRVGNQQDVHISGYNLPESFISQFSKLSFPVIHHAISEPDAREFGGEGEILCRRRYFDAANVGQSYEAMCVLDADMWLVRPVEQYFEIAAKTDFILGATLEQKRMYGEHEHESLADGTPTLPGPVWNHKDICCAPIFVDMRKHCVIFKRSWMIFREGYRAPDMAAINAMILAHSYSDKVLPLSNTVWVNSNEKALKPYIRFIRHDKDPEPGFQLWTETGDPVYIVHGQYYKQSWRDQQLLNRIGCTNGYLGGSTKSIRMAHGALEQLYRCFQTLQDGPIVIEHKAYTPSGDPGDSFLSEAVDATFRETVRV